MAPPRNPAGVLLAKAEDDYWAIAQMSGAPVRQVWLVGFHAQQAVEKSIKAVLAHRGIAYPFTHDLRTLLNRLDHHGIPLPPHAPRLVFLSRLAVSDRYDDLEPIPSFDVEWAREAAETTIAWAHATIHGQT